MTDIRIIVPLATPFEPQQSSGAWLGDNLTNEYGCIAQNDAWADTIYEYIPQYAPTIPTIPTPTLGDPLPTSNGVNDNASDEYFAFDATGYQAALNNTVYRVVFLVKGSDYYTGYEDQEIMTSGNGGTAGTPRWFVWCDPDTPANGLDPKPWEMQEADKVYMPWQTRCDGADYCYWVGLCYGKDLTRGHAAMRFLNGTSNHTIYRCLEEYSGGNELADGTKSYDQWIIDRNASGRQTWTSFQIANSAGDSIVFYESVFRKGGKFEEEKDQIKVDGGNNHRIVSCEFSDGNNASVQVSDSYDGYGTVIEDCMFYKRRYSVTSDTSSGVATLDVNGDYVAGDAATGVKSTAGVGSADTNVRYYGNIFYNLGPGTEALDDTPTSGLGIAFSSPGTSSKVDIRQNVFFDFDDQTAISMQTGGASQTNIHPTNSVINNLFYNIQNTNFEGVCLSINTDDTELYSNTFSEMDQCTYCMDSFAFTPDTFDDFDMMANFFQNIPTNSFPNLDDARTVGEQVGYNAYAGTYTAYNAVYGNDYEHGSDPSTLFMGSFRFYRNKLTTPVLVTIPGVVPTKDTPSSFLIGVTANQVGARSGIGVDDNILR